jgi:type IV secretory pathway TraG/TraD family ATPase VirD4
MHEVRIMPAFQKNLESVLAKALPKEVPQLPVYHYALTGVGQMRDSARNSKLLDGLGTGFDAMRSRSSRPGDPFALLGRLGEGSVFGDPPPINLETVARLLPAAARPPARLVGPTRSEPLGTADWMPAADAAKRFGFDDSLFSQNQFELWNGRSNGQIWLGETLDERRDALGYADDRHVAVFGGNRVGKGTSFAIPTLCLWPGSCFVIDPHGENTAITAQRRGNGSEYSLGLKQQVRVLDPYGAVQLPGSLKSRFNPLDTINPELPSAVVKASRIAASIFVAEKRDDIFFAEATRRFVKAIILHVVSAEEFEGQRNLLTVWKLVNQGDWINAEILKKHGKKERPFDLLWEGMVRNGHFNGLVAGIGEQMATMAEKTRDGILKTAATNLEFLDDPEMQAVVEASDFRLSDLKADAGGLSLYVTLPSEQLQDHYRWLRLMTDLAVSEMRQVKGRPATGFPTLFLLDEFPSLKRMEVIENGAAEAAKFGIKFFFIAQMLGQLKDLYGENWETFLGNAGLKIFTGVDDDFTKSYLSRQLGEYEVRRETRSGSDTQTRGGTISRSRSRTLGHTTSSGTSTSTGHSSTTGHSTSENSGKNRSHSDGWSGWIIPRPSWSSGTGWTEGSGSSESASQTESTSKTESKSSSYSISEAISESASVSQSVSETQGWGEAIHRRSLLNPDEIARRLGRVSDKDHPHYPGLAVAMISGERPLLVKRVNYFEAPRFRAFFDPHPEHEPPQRLADYERVFKERRAAADGLKNMRAPPGFEDCWRAGEDAERLRREQRAEAERERLKREAFEAAEREKERLERERKKKKIERLALLAVVMTLIAGYGVWRMVWGG